MNLEIIISEIRQTQKDKYHMISLTHVVKNFNLVKEGSRMVIIRRWADVGQRM
jgi:hypothetical protein